MPDAAKEAAKRLVSISDVEGDVKVGDIVLGNQLKIVAPEKAPSVVDVTADFPFQAKLVNSFQPFGPGQVQAAAISALQLDGLDLADPLMAWKVAGALLRADRPAMTAFLVALTSAYLDRVACPGGVPALALYIWPFSWVPAKARAKLAAIPRRPPDKRGVALNSANHETALAYVRCAPLPQDMVKRVPVGPPDGEQTLADLVQRVSTLIENEVGAPVHERLAFHIGRGRMVLSCSSGRSTERRSSSSGPDFRRSRSSSSPGRPPRRRRSRPRALPTSAWNTSNQRSRKGSRAESTTTGGTSTTG